MVGHGGSSAGLYLANPTSPIPTHCASIVATSTVRVKLRPDVWLAIYKNIEHGHNDTENVLTETRFH